ncbi:MAG: hypothetical protein H0U75_04625 [Legionella sp.]|nr:hypothetical protein [Legionella sp.]
MNLNVLLLCNKAKAGNNANAILDHIESIEHYSNHTIWLYSNVGDFSEKLDLNKFDVIIIHYSLSIFFKHFISDKAKKQISDFNGLKVVLLQDEYRQINKIIAVLQQLKVDVLLTCFPETEMGKIYTNSALPNLSLYNNLTGYIPERLLRIPLPSTKDRPIHVGYRARKLPFWYGELSFEKWDIVEKWKALVNRQDIEVDLSYKERDRIYGDGWLDFIKSCKATLGVESGASVVDFTGELEKKVELHQLTNPQDNFHKVQTLFLKEYEGKYKLNQISPRCFEAIALKTVLILYEGEYSNILIPERHYIVLKKDYSNINEVVAKLLDPDHLQTVANTAYEEIALNPAYSYKTYINYLDEILTREFKARTIEKTKIPYTKEQFAMAIRCIPFNKRMHALTLICYYKLPDTLKSVVKLMVNPDIVSFFLKSKLKRIRQIKSLLLNNKA